MGSICGYCGTGNDQLVDQMLSRLEHRGPRGQATWSNPRIGLGCNSERDDLGYPNYQVATSADGNVTCVLDGYLFNQQQLAENLQRNGGFVLGIRPGKPTQDYLNRVIVRITLGGALFLGFIAVVPYLASLITDVQAIALSSTSLLIMVGVGLDTLRQLEAQLMMRNYEGFLR